MSSVDYRICIEELARVDGISALAVGLAQGVLAA
jgi:hypothetical protein